MAFADSYVKKRTELARVNRIDNLRGDWLAIRRSLAYCAASNKAFRVHTSYLNEDTIRCLSYIGFTPSGDKVLEMVNGEEAMFLILDPR